MSVFSNFACIPTSLPEPGKPDGCGNVYIESIYGTESNFFQDYKIQLFVAATVLVTVLLIVGYKWRKKHEKI